MRRALIALALVYALVVPATAQQRAHAFLRPEVGAPRVVGGAVVAAPVPTATRPGRDRDLLPYYGAVGAATFFDLRYTRLAIDAGAVEVNPLLVRAARVGGDKGRDAASIALSVGYCAVVRQFVYGRSPARAKLALVLFAGLRFGLGFLNKRNIRILSR